MFSLTHLKNASIGRPTFSRTLSRSDWKTVFPSWLLSHSSNWSVLFSKLDKNSGFRMAFIYDSLNTPVTLIVWRYINMIMKNNWSSQRMAISRRGKTSIVTYSTDRKDSKILIISLLRVSRVRERSVLFTRNGFNFLTHLESSTSHFAEIVVKRLFLMHNFTSERKVKLLIAKTLNHTWQ